MENDARSFPCFAHNIVIYAYLAAHQEDSVRLEGQACQAGAAGLRKYSRDMGNIRQFFPYINELCYLIQLE